MTRWQQHQQAWHGSSSQALLKAPLLPDRPLDRLALQLHLLQAVAPLELRQARWLTTCEHEQILFLLVAARLRRGHPRCTLVGLEQDIDAALAQRVEAPWEEVDDTELAKRLAQDGKTLKECLNQAWQNAMKGSLARVGSHGPSALLRMAPDGRSIAFARWDEAEYSLLQGLREKLRQKSFDVDPDHLERLVAKACNTLPALHADQILAVKKCPIQPFLVLEGGPGTGKTTVVARILQVWLELDPNRCVEDIALCAPTGRAKARLLESVSRQWYGMEAFKAHTLHSLLGASAGGQWRHNATHPLPQQLVVVDEASMVDLGVFAALLDALAPDAQLLLVGDPQQLPSVEAGSVLADLVHLLEPLPNAPLVRLRHSHRNRGAIAQLADELKRGKTRAAQDLARAAKIPAAPLMPNEDGSVHWMEGPLEKVLEHWWQHRSDASVEMEDPLQAVSTLESSRILCLTHAGPTGRETINQLGDQWLQARHRSHAASGIGRPVILGRNLPRLDLWNGDLGVGTLLDQNPVIAFARTSADRILSAVCHHPATLESLEPAWAITVHKSQGSEFDHVLIVLPSRDSPLLTRQILYTALTRARRSVWIYGDPALWNLAATRVDERPSRLRSEGL